VTFEKLVHPSIDTIDFQWVFANELRGELGQTCANPKSIRRKINRPERAAFPPAYLTGIGMERNDGRVEDGYGFATAPLVSGFVEGQIHSINSDFTDAHRIRPGVWL
jgi:hypothetical protein